MLSPVLCGCGCLQPMFTGDDKEVSGFLHNHHKKAGIPSYLVLDIGYKTKCWVWQQGLNKWGYPKVKRNRKTLGGHRLFYRAYVGEIHHGRYHPLDHLCRIRKCVMPEHVEPVTLVENIRRGLVPMLTEKQVLSVSPRYLAGESERQIANDLGVAQSCIHKILRGINWRGLVVPTPTRSPIKLSLEQVEQIRSLCSSGETRQSLANKFGMGYSTICKIVRGHSWAASM
jgi:hypothetical protein